MTFGESADAPSLSALLTDCQRKREAGGPTWWCWRESASSAGTVSWRRASSPSSGAPEWSLVPGCSLRISTISYFTTALFCYSFSLHHLQRFTFLIWSGGGSASTQTCITCTCKLAPVLGWDTEQTLHDLRGNKSTGKYLAAKTSLVEKLPSPCRTQRLVSAVITSPLAVCLCHAGWLLDPGQGRRDRRGWGQTLGPSCVYPSCFPHTEKPWNRRIIQDQLNTHHQSRLLLQRQIYSLRQA